MAADLVPEPPDAKQRLLAAAEAVFAEKGFAAASVREITRAADVNIAAINYHFGDKERLYVETVKYAHSCSMDGRPLPAFPPHMNPADKLTAFIREMVTRMHAPARPTSMKLMMREMADPGVAAGVVVDEFIQPMAFMLRAILRELLPEADDHHLLMTGFSVIGQCLYYRQNRPISELIFGKPALDALTADAVAAHVIRFTLLALGLGPAAVTSRHVVTS